MKLVGNLHNLGTHSVVIYIDYHSWVLGNGQTKSGALTSTETLTEKRENNSSQGFTIIDRQTCHDYSLIKGDIDRRRRGEEPSTRCVRRSMISDSYLSFVLVK